MAHQLFTNQQSNVVRVETSSFTDSRILHELGWFEDAELFIQICRKQKVPAIGQPDEVFEMWKSDLLLTISTNYKDLWTLDDGCS